MLYVPFIIGVLLFSFNIVNLFSSLLLFLGGYIAIKNTFDYRMVRKNVNSISNKTSYDNYSNVREPTFVKPVKKIKRNIRVRKRTRE